MTVIPHSALRVRKLMRVFSPEWWHRLTLNQRQHFEHHMLNGKLGPESRAVMEEVIAKLRGQR
jgi:hypothetical protein